MRLGCWMLGFAIVAGACVGTTGGDLVTFPAYASGPADATAGQPFRFMTSLGYDVTLTTARLHIGAVYMNQSTPASVSQDTSCTLAGIYVAEVTGGLDVDVLSPALQPFPTPGFGTTEKAKTGEVWLMGGNVNAETDPTVILQITGTATKEGVAYPFEGAITIGQNRSIPPDPAQPGASPICKQRVVSPIRIELTPRAGGQLVVRVDPRGLFNNVELSELEQVQQVPPLYRFKDTSADQPSTNLYNNLHASVGVYEFTWEN